MASRSPTRGERCHAGPGLALDAPRKSRRLWALRALTTERDQLVRRFPSAEAADLLKEGAASFQRQLVKGDLASEYENELRLWLEELD